MWWPFRRSERLPAIPVTDGVRIGYRGLPSRKRAPAARPQDTPVTTDYRVICSGCGLDQEVVLADYLSGQVHCRGCGRTFAPRNGWTAVRPEL